MYTQVIKLPGQIAFRRAGLQTRHTMLECSIIISVKEEFIGLKLTQESKIDRTEFEFESCNQADFSLVSHNCAWYTIIENE